MVPSFRVEAKQLPSLRTVCSLKSYPASRIVSACTSRFTRFNGTVALISIFKTSRKVGAIEIFPCKMLKSFTAEVSARHFSIWFKVNRLFEPDFKKILIHFCATLFSSSRFFHRRMLFFL